VLGIRRAALFGNLVTIAKLAPLLLFVGIGLFAHRLGAPSARRSADQRRISREAVLLLAFAFVGWESVVVAAGETRDPRRHLPRALIAGLASSPYCMD
jgi:basic amino acid/polyamine antiporter, APA family